MKARARGCWRDFVLLLNVVTVLSKVGYFQRPVGCLALSALASLSPRKEVRNELRRLGKSYHCFGSGVFSE